MGHRLLCRGGEAVALLAAAASVRVQQFLSSHWSAPRGEGRRPRSKCKNTQLPGDGMVEVNGGDRRKGQ